MEKRVGWLIAWTKKTPPLELWMLGINIPGMQMGMLNIPGIPMGRGMSNFPGGRALPGGRGSRHPTSPAPNAVPTRDRNVSVTRSTSRWIAIQASLQTSSLASLFVDVDSFCVPSSQLGSQNHIYPVGSEAGGGSAGYSRIRKCTNTGMVVRHFFLKWFGSPLFFFSRVVFRSGVASTTFR